MDKKTTIKNMLSNIDTNMVELRALQDHLVTILDNDEAQARAEAQAEAQAEVARAHTELRRRARAAAQAEAARAQAQAEAARAQAQAEAARAQAQAEAEAARAQAQAEAEAARAPASYSSFLDIKAISETRKIQKLHENTFEMTQQALALTSDPEWMAISESTNKQTKKRLAVKVITNNAPNNMVTNKELFEIIKKAGLSDVVGTGKTIEASLRNTLQEATGCVAFSRHSTINGLSQIHPVSASLRSQRAKISIDKYLLNSIKGVYVVVNSELRMNELMNEAAEYERQHA